MESRVNKYRDVTEEENTRSIRNKDIYDSMYKKGYEDVKENVTKVKPNEVNLDKLRELLKKEDDNEFHIVKKESQIDIPNFELDDDKKYDLRDILDKAKTTREEEPDKLRSLRNTEYDILRGIDIKEKLKEEEQKEELKKMIDDVNNTSALNKLNDKELSLDLFSDLEATKTVSRVKEETEEIDKSFYTSSLGFTSNDFEELKDINTNLQKDNKVIKVLLILILLFMVAASIFVVINFI